MGRKVMEEERKEREGEEEEVERIVREERRERKGIKLIFVKDTQHYDEISLCNELVLTSSTEISLKVEERKGIGNHTVY